jgi:hypothetical protein
MEQAGTQKKSIRDVIYTDKKISDISSMSWKEILLPKRPKKTAADEEDADGQAPVFIAKHSRAGIVSLVMTGLAIVLLIVFVVRGLPALQAALDAGITDQNFVNETVPDEIFAQFLLPGFSFFIAIGLMVMSFFIGIFGVLQRKKRITRLASLSVLILLVMIIVMVLLFMFL